MSGTAGTASGGGEAPEAAGPESPPSPTEVTLPRFDDALFEAVRRAGHHRVALQVPAGLVRNAHRMAEELRRESGADVLVLARPAFGACDFPSAPEALDADALVVLGHAPIPNVARSLPMYFVEMRYPATDAAPLADRVAAAALPRKLGLVASVQHLDLVEPLRAALEARGFEVPLGRGDRRLAHSVQALGCNYTVAESVRTSVEGFLFLGTGRFHPVGLALAVDRPDWTLDPLQGTLDPPIDRSALIRNRLRQVARAMGATRFGIVVSSFAGQNRSGMADALVQRARRAGRSAEILLVDRLDPRDLEGRDVEAYVVTACPRIAIDDTELYPKPMLTAPEFLMVLGELPLEPYRFDTYH